MPSKPGDSTRQRAGGAPSAQPKGRQVNFAETEHKELFDLVRSLRDLDKRATREYRPVVEDILRTGNRDVQHIEHTLDHILDFCGYEPMLELFKRLCRHYWLIDPAATASYVYAYRDWWDSDEADGA